VECEILEMRGKSEKSKVFMENIEKKVNRTKFCCELRIGQDRFAVRRSAPSEKLAVGTLLLYRG
jgi:hypothetical protein